MYRKWIISPRKVLGFTHQQIAKKAEEFKKSILRGHTKCACLFHNYSCVHNFSINLKAAIFDGGLLALNLRVKCHFALIEIDAGFFSPLYYILSVKHFIQPIC